MLKLNRKSREWNVKLQLVFFWGDTVQGFRFMAVIALVNVSQHLAQTQILGTSAGTSPKTLTLQPKPGNRFITTTACVRPRESKEAQKTICSDWMFSAQSFMNAFKVLGARV